MTPVRGLVTEEQRNYRHPATSGANPLGWDQHRSRSMSFSVCALPPLGGEGQGGGADPGEQDPRLSSYTIHSWATRKIIRQSAFG